ncbi:hypothetical protein OVY01_07445 [Robbsia sp. Bb-Pol-6]|uniref:Type III secretion protein HrpB7 n=1 Tax=Robbsia betulipollinis TaxID=2981849 RepID=A0ABT3ZKK9_9BURK|nr:hypothetical protein [Robbsia betulipollinis]MCY0387070.1 hypothetical protein [Robbsia betulipollinis]
MNQALRSWKTILLVKERARTRAEETLSRARAELAERTRAVDAAEAQRQEQAARRAAAGHALSDVLAGAGHVAPDAYLLHKAYMTRLDGDLAVATKACEAALRHQVHAQGQVDAAQRVFARADASLEACRDKQRDLQTTLARRVEEAADEEACETAAGRLFRVTHA